MSDQNIAIQSAARIERQRCAMVCDHLAEHWTRKAETEPDPLAVAAMTHRASTARNLASAIRLLPDLPA